MQTQKGASHEHTVSFWVTVKVRIYRAFMHGKTVGAIARELTADGIPTPGGKVKWQSSTVESILRNEKYRGDARLQKKFTVDFLQKKMKVNEGKVPQYYVENSPPAIVEPEEWDLVQAEFTRRKELGKRYSSSSIFSSMIFCGDCGAMYGSKVWHSTDKYRRTIWQCNDKFKGEHRCTTLHLYEEDIKVLFLRAFSKLMDAREHVLDDCRLVQNTLCDCADLDTEQAALVEEMDILSEVIRRCVEENTVKVQNQDEYYERYDRHVPKYDKLKKRYEAIEAERQRRKEQSDRLRAFISTIHEQEQMPIEFTDETVVFAFKNGTRITEQMI